MSVAYTEMSVVISGSLMSLMLDNQMHIHRGHADAKKALYEWLAYTRRKSNEVVKDWSRCEQVDPERLSLAERVNRGHHGDNVVTFRRSDMPALDSLDQLPKQSFSYSVENMDIKCVIADINTAVYEYFYAPSTVITYSDFCNLLEQIKVETDRVYHENQSVSPYERDRDLLHCHYAFIYAGWGKLEGDVDQGVSIETAESIESVVVLLTSISDQMAQDKASQFMRQKVLAAQSMAESMRNRMAGLHSLPTLSRSPAK